MTYPNTYAVPKIADSYGWEAKLLGEVLILGGEIERLTVDDPHTEYDDSGLPLMDRIKCCGTNVQTLQNKTYSNSRVHGNGRFDGHTVLLSNNSNLTCDFEV